MSKFFAQFELKKERFQNWRRLAGRAFYMTFDIVSKTNCPKSEPPILLCERYQLDFFLTHQFLNASVLYGSCLDCGSIDKVGDLWMSMRKWPSEEYCPWWSQLPSRITRYASDSNSGIMTMWQRDVKVTYYCGMQMPWKLFGYLEEVA